MWLDPGIGVCTEVWGGYLQYMHGVVCQLGSQVRMPMLLTVLLLVMVGLQPSLLAAEPVPVPAGSPAPELPAATEYRGRREIRTEQFRIIYEAGYEDAAREVYGFADEVYEAATGFLGYEPRERIPVVIWGGTAEANGYFTPIPSSIHLFVTAPSDELIGVETENWLRLLFLHELVHYIHLTKPQGFVGGLSQVFGRTLMALNTVFMPGWYVEGIAVYLETRFTSGGRGREPVFETRYKAPVLEGEMWSLRQAAYGSYSAPRDRIYVAGYLLVEYLVRHYGDDVFARIHSEYVRSPFHTLDGAIRRVTGIRTQLHHKRMIWELEEKYAHAGELSGGERLELGRAAAFMPTMSERGALSYLYGKDMAPGLYLLNGSAVGTAESPPGTGETVTQLLVDVRPSDPYSFDITPDGSLLVFTAAGQLPRHASGMASVSDLYLVQVDVDSGAGNPVALTRNARLWQPAVHPSGSEVSVVQRYGSYSRLVRYSTAANNDPTEAVSSVVFSESGARVRYPRYSPSGDRLVFLVDRSGTRALVLVEKGEVTELIPAGSAGLYHPRFLDEDTLLLGAEQDGELVAQILDIPTGRRSTVLQDPVGVYGAVPLPPQPGARSAGSGEGGAIGVLYASYRSDGHAVFSATAALPDWRAEPPGSRAEPPDWPVPELPTQPRSPTQLTQPSPPAFPTLPESRRYYGLPRPVLWLPLLTASAGGDRDPVIAPGLLVVGAEYAGRSMYSLASFYDIAHQQPQLYWNASYDFGPVAAVYDLEHEYRELSEDIYIQELRNTLTLQTPWIAPQAVGPRRTLLTRAGVSHLMERAAVGSFGFQDRSPDWMYRTGLLAGFSYGTARSAPLSAIYGGRAVALSGSVLVEPKQLGGSTDRVRTRARILARTPAVPSRATLQLSTEAVSSSRDGVGGLLTPRLSDSWDDNDGDTKFIVGLDYRIPWGLFDHAVPPFAVTALGSGVFVEFAAWADYGEAPRPDDYFYPGVELSGEFRFSMLPWTGGVQFGPRVRRDLSEYPAYEDYRLTIFLGAAGFSLE